MILNDPDLSIMMMKLKFMYCPKHSCTSISGGSPLHTFLPSPIHASAIQSEERGRVKMAKSKSH